MGDKRFTSYSFETAAASEGIKFHVSDDGTRKATSRVTHRAEQRSRETGKLDPSVDPAVLVIRRSLPRFEETPDGHFRMTVGCPMDIESTCDTTGSMGSNVQTMIEVLPETYGIISEVLPGYDPQLALGIFGDKCDRFIINRPQFEMTAEKIVKYITKLVPEGNGGDGPEDPHYAVFGAAYLTDTYTNRIGLKGYHFVITDAHMHDERLDPNQIERVYGENVWKELADNGHPEITRRNLPSQEEMFKALHKRAHAFLIGLGASEYFRDYYDENHRIDIEDTSCLPAIEAAIIGLTEGTLQPMDLNKFLKKHRVSEDNIRTSRVGLNRVPFAAQRKLEQKAGIVIPKAGDIFETKTDLQPMPSAPVLELPPKEKPKKSSWI